MASQHNPESSKVVDTENENTVDLSYIGSREESADSRSIASRQRLRDQLSDEVQAFLAKGGQISQVDSSVTADPPKRPSSSYGQRPI